MSTSGLLDGIRVLDFSIWRPGPYATQLLAEAGADVIKVEPPGGDPMRAYPGLFEALNVNKRSVELDLKRDEHVGRAHELARAADVVIEGFRPGVAARLRVAYADLVSVNPRVVYCSLSGLGQSGPLAAASGHDLNYQAWAGALAPDGGNPVVAAVPMADLAGGVAAAFAICAAVIRQLRTGEGEYIDVSMTDVLATWTGAVRPLARGTDPSARGVPGYGLFETADGAIALGIITEDHFWRALCDELALDDARDLSFVERVARVDEMQERIARAVKERRRDELVDAFLGAAVPAAPVLDRDAMLALPHLRERGVALEGATGHLARYQHHPAGARTRAPARNEHPDAMFT